jgi:signal transduction histidine kinase
LWYGALFALVLLLITVLSYSLHVREHYDDRDRALVTSAGHMAGEARAMPNGPHLVEGSGGLEVGFWLYDAQGMVREQTPDIASLIQGNLELIRRHPEMPPADRDEAVAEREATRLTRLVADLLALARADAGVRLRQEMVDLDAVALEAFRSVRALAHGQELALDTLEPVQVIGDADRLKQLLLIVLDNALKYTPSGGHVTMGLRQCAGGGEITVRDTGVGIAAADLPRVFERFYRADLPHSRDAGGTGLGLPIARWIAEQHHGTIHIDSTPGQGTTVTVSLPTHA